MNLFMNRKQPALGVSSCLLGMNVRYDGKNEHHCFISSVLNKHFELLPVCPEVAIGMGVPRAPIQLRILDSELHAIGVNNHAQDVTTALQAYGQQQTIHARAICGYVFKSRSPSCGVSDTRIISDHGVSAGPGIYAREILRALPWLPVIDETQLDMAEKKDNFLERVFSLARWHQSVAAPVTVSCLMNFYTTHYLILAAHSDKANEALSATISVLRDPLSHEVIDDYLEQFHNYLKMPLTHKDHIRILTKLQQRLAAVISCDEKERLDIEIKSYRENPGELVLPLQHIKRLADSYNLYDLARQTYINPTPAEIALRYCKQ
ncbi:MAG TPA: hypothetical protein DDW55_08515 [Gammaproteobacteria bacterium]|nr:hypothetical protein [Gammaproteobacteria bacterium]